MIKLTFQYFNRYDERVERSVHGETKKDAFLKADKIAWDDGDGDVSVVSIRDITLQYN